MQSEWKDLVKARSATLHAVTSNRVQTGVIHATGCFAAALLAALVVNPVWPVAVALVTTAFSWLYLHTLQHQRLSMVLLDEDVADHIGTVSDRLDTVAKEVTRISNAHTAMSNRLGSSTGISLGAGEAVRPFNRLGR